MIYGKPDIKEYFKKLGKKYFAIYHRGKVETGNAIFKTEENEDTDTDSAFRNFEEMLNLLRTGEYTLICNNDPKVGTRGSNREDFRVTMDESLNATAREAVSGINAPAGQFSYEDMLSKSKIMALEEFEKLQAKKELEDLKGKHTNLEKELKEAQRKVDDPWNKFIGALAPHADPIIAGIMGNQRPIIGGAVSGVKPSLQLDENATTEQISEHAQKVFEDFALALQTAKPTEWLEILVKLTTLIRSNPTKFETAINFL